MPPSQPLTSQEDITPKEFFEVIKFGTGMDFDLKSYKDFLKEKGERGSYIIHQTRERIEELTGFEPFELLDIASKKTSPDENEYDKYKAAQKAIRRQLRETLLFSQKHLGCEANKYIEDLVDKYFSGEESLKINDEVKICNDTTDLVLMAFNDNMDSEVKYQAARKLLVMMFLGEIKNHSREADDNALHYIMEIYNESILEVPEGERIGWTTPRYLVSWHEPVIHKTIRTEILETKPTDIDENDLVQVTKIPSRKTTVESEDKTGKGREIYFSMEWRNKTFNSRLTKALRYDSPIGEKDLDKNGIRKCFKNREDWDDFFRFYKATIQRRVLEELCEMHEDSINEIEAAEILKRINNIDDNIEIYDEKDSLDGNDFNGSASSSSKKLKIFKFKMKIKVADGTTHQLEYQIFLHDGYADEKYRKGMSQREYHADRFFREGVDELLFPKAHYPEIDREKAYKKAMRQAHEKVWDEKSTRPPANC